MFRKFVKRFHLSQKGAALVEMALCGPPLFILIFFIFEIIKIVVFQIALDTISLELSFDYAGNKTTKNFNNIIRRNILLPFFSADDIGVNIVCGDNLHNFIKTTGENFPSSVRGGIYLVSPYVQGDDLTQKISSGCPFELTVVGHYKSNLKIATQFFQTAVSGNGMCFYSRAVCICN
ncbi:MAG: hypothetical protein E7015_00375 [Alphaproteobacteria bacterium]|nr:hypothetical protein [Alphaproteobacteria bacterium]